MLAPTRSRALVSLRKACPVHFARSHNRNYASKPLHEFAILVQFRRGFRPESFERSFINEPNVTFFGRFDEHDDASRRVGWCLSYNGEDVDSARALVGRDSDLMKAIDALRVWPMEVVHTSDMNDNAAQQ